MYDSTTFLLETLAITAAPVALIGWAVWLVSRVQTQKVKGRHDLQRRLLEKIDDRSALDTFLQSASGRRFFDSIERADAVAAILTATGRGVVLLALGAGFVVVRWVYPAFSIAHVLGILLLAAGVGLLVSARVSRRLARRLGLSLGEEVPEPK